MTPRITAGISDSDDELWREKRKTYTEEDHHH
jgi:hypothetical protein